MEDNEERIPFSEPTQPTTNEVIKLMANDLFSRISLPRLNVRTIGLVTLLLLIGLLAGLTYAWLISPVEYIAPPVTIGNFSVETQELTTLGLANLMYMTKGESYNTQLLNQSIQELGVNAETLCNIHYKYPSFVEETTFLLQSYAIQCVP